jgi:hypothetical protein
MSGTRELESVTHVSRGSASAPKRVGTVYSHNPASHEINELLAGTTLAFFLRKKHYE